jgi:hypothetical protein
MRPAGRIACFAYAELSIFPMQDSEGLALSLRCEPSVRRLRGRAHEAGQHRVRVRAVVGINGQTGPGYSWRMGGVPAISRAGDVWGGDTGGVFVEGVMRSGGVARQPSPMVLSRGKARARKAEGDLCPNSDARGGEDGRKSCSTAGPGFPAGLARFPQAAAWAGFLWTNR